MWPTLLTDDVLGVWPVATVLSFTPPLVFLPYCLK
jgi:hypothetical protein